MLWDLPGPRRFLSGALDALEQGRHALFLLPTSVSRSELRNEILRGLRGRSLGELTSIRIEGAHVDPLDPIRERLGLGAASVDELLSTAQRPSRFLAIDCASTDGDCGCVAFLRRAASFSQVNGGSTLQLLGLRDATERSTRTDVFLSVHAWWGTISQLDVDWLTKERLEQLPPRSAAERYWIRALCRGLAHCDVELASLLVEKRPRDFGSILALLSSMVPDRLEARNLQEARRLAERCRATRAPESKTAVDLWHAGFIDGHEDLGGIVLTRALTLVGDEEEVRRRLWLGQLEVLMPFVEQARLAVSNFLAQEYGDGWPSVLKARARHPDNGLEQLEIGPLASLAATLRERGFPLPKRCSAMIFAWRDLRNELAHRQPVEFSLCERAFESWQRLVDANG